MTTIGRIDDHVLLLQLERANEALSDRVDDLEDPDDACDCDCAEGDIDRLLDRMVEAADLLALLTNRVVELEHEVASLGTNQDKLLDALRRVVTGV